MMNWIHVCMILLSVEWVCQGHRLCYVIEGRSGCVYHMMASSIAQSTSDLKDRCKVVDHSVAAWSDRLKTLRETFKKINNQKGAAHATSPYIYTVPCPPLSTNPEPGSLFIGGYTDMSSWINGGESLGSDKDL